MEAHLGACVEAALGAPPRHPCERVTRELELRLGSSGAAATGTAFVAGVDASQFYALFEALDTSACVGAAESSTHEHYDAAPGLRACAGEWLSKRPLLPHADFPCAAAAGFVGNGAVVRIAYGEERVLDGPPGAVLRARAHAARAANPLAHAAARRALPATVRARTRRALVLRCAPHWRLDFTRVRVSGHPGDASAAAAPRDVYELELEMMMAPAQPASPTALVVAECMAALAALAAAGRTVAADAARRRREYEMQRMAEEYVGARA